MAQLCIVFKKTKYVAKQLYLQCRELGAPVEYLIPSCLYEKEPLQLCFIELQKKAVIFLCQNLIMRCFMTILAEFYGDPIFSDPVGVLSIRCDPIQVLFIRSDPVRVLSIRSDPIRSRFCKCLFDLAVLDSCFDGSGGFVLAALCQCFGFSEHAQGNTCQEGFSPMTN